MDEQRSTLVASVEEALLDGCSLRKLAEGSRLSPLSPSIHVLPPPSPPPPPTRAQHGARDNADHGEEQHGTRHSNDDRGVRLVGVGRSDATGFGHTPPRTYTECAAGAATAVGLVRYLEGTVTAAERAYAKRAGGLVRLRAAVALRERHEESRVSGAREEARVGGEGEEARFGGEGEESRVGGEFESREEVGDRAAGVGVGVGRGRAVGCGDCSALFEANERLIREARHRGLLG